MVKAEKSRFVQIGSESAQTRFSFTAVRLTKSVRWPSVCRARAAISVKPTAEASSRMATKQCINLLMSERVVVSVSQGA